MSDEIKHPKHYQHPSGRECIELVQHLTFMPGNVGKYVFRHSMKNGIQDLRKAKQYLDMAIARLENPRSVEMPFQALEDWCAHEPDKNLVKAMRLIVNSAYSGTPLYDLKDARKLVGQVVKKHNDQYR